MSAIWAEISIIIVLIFFNGVFAMSEFAIVSARKARLQQAAEEGDSRAGAALEIANAPGTFLSTIQIGITLIGILAGAYGGATVAAELSSYLAGFPELAAYRDSISLGLVVIIITYASLVVGELVPKRIALNNPERLAALVAKPMQFLSTITLPFVHILNVSTKAVLSMLRVKPAKEPPVTEEEVKILIEQGARSGVFEEMEQDMIESVFRLADRKVSSVMTARPDVVSLDLDDPPEVNWKIMSESRHSNFPVYQASWDNIVGIASIKVLWEKCQPGLPSDLKPFLSKPLFIPENLPALKLLGILRQSGVRMAVVVDEYGAVQGLVTPQDIFKSIIGELAYDYPTEEPYAVQREDGSWLVDGMLPIDEFKEMFHISQILNEREGRFNTLGGFVMTHMGRVPSVGDHFEWAGSRLEVVDMDGRRVDKVLVTPLEKESE